MSITGWRKLQAEDRAGLRDRHLVGVAVFREQVDDRRFEVSFQIGRSEPDQRLGLSVQVALDVVGNLHRQARGI